MCIAGDDKIRGIGMVWLSKAAACGDVFAMWKLACVYGAMTCQSVICRKHMNVS